MMRMSRIGEITVVANTDGANPGMHSVFENGVSARNRGCPVIVLYMMMDATRN